MITLRLIAEVEQRADAAEWLRLASYSETLFVYYANQVPVIFSFKRADNDENRARGIVGQNSGFRQGVRNLNYVPAAQHPENGGSAQPLGTTIKYYDKGRQKWRSYRKGNLLSITAFWSEAEQKYVDTPEEAGIARGEEFKATPRDGAAQIDEARAERNDQRQARQRAREADRQAYRTTDRSRREDRRRQNQLTRSSR